MSYGNYPDLKQVKRILVVKMRHHGDVLLSSPVFSNLKKTIPTAEIDAFIYKDTFPMLKGHPAISNFLLYDRTWKQLSWGRKMIHEVGLFRLLFHRHLSVLVLILKGKVFWGKERVIRMW